MNFFGFLCQVKNTWYVARKTAILFCVKIPKSNTLKNVRLTLFIVSESIYTKSATINLHYSIDGYQVAQRKKKRCWNVTHLFENRLWDLKYQRLIKTKTCYASAWIFKHWSIRYLSLIINLPKMNLLISFKQSSQE